MSDWYLIRNGNQLRNAPGKTREGEVMEYFTIETIPVPILPTMQNLQLLFLGEWVKITEEQAREYAEEIIRRGGSIGPEAMEALGLQPAEVYKTDE